MESALDVARFVCVGMTTGLAFIIVVAVSGHIWGWAIAVYDWITKGEAAHM